jgi:hypothetical protein
LALSNFHIVGWITIGMGDGIWLIRRTGKTIEALGASVDMENNRE